MGGRFSLHATGDGHGDEADVPARHGHPRHPLLLGDGRGRGDGLHAGRPTPTRSPIAIGWFASITGIRGKVAVRGPHRAAVRLRPPDPPDAGRRQRTARVLHRRPGAAGEVGAPDDPRRGRRHARGSPSRPATSEASWSSPAADPASGVGHGEIIQLFEETSAFWREWIGRSRYRGRWREMVERSAITLKLMTYAPTGALVAAPTAGLPEQVGGERNWDYRYTWVRDALVLRLRAAGPRLHRRGRRVRAVAPRSGGEPTDGQRHAAGHHVPGRRQLGSGRGDARPLGGLPGLVPGPHRQRCGRAAPARHLRRSDGRHPPRCPQRLGGGGRRMERPGWTARLGGRQLGPARRRGVGDPRGPATLRLRPAHVLGGARSRRPSGRSVGSPGCDRALA